MSRGIALPKIIALVGPTASGKTDLSLAIAKRYGGEIVSADSRQFYAGMDIGADVIKGRWGRGAGGQGGRVYRAKGVPHHLLAFRSPADPLTLAEFQGMAIAAINDILSRGKVPVLAGGTGLYIRAVVDNYAVPAVAPDRKLRARLEKRGTASLFAELRKKDPAYASRISANNRRYAIRALEVFGATGKPFSALQEKGEPLYDALQIGIKRPRAEMYARIERRVDSMMRRGLLAEAKRLGRRYGWDSPPLSALGHRQLGSHLRGEMTLAEAVSRIKRDTRRYAKRQMTWFRREKRIHWVDEGSQALRLVDRFLGRERTKGKKG